MTRAKIGGFLDYYKKMHPLKPKIKKDSFLVYMKTYDNAKFVALR